ncbi:uncharacterized protein SCHCODRAFT_01152362 [Schizophyllum commune H4-8]|nr:uncharacterized protein SCHCODRAFT_01152362 [Schizophyllum commune H4-8]KAI5892273.1 hypothetical protein SCHCODRAFT_01152362 [Schizophyllum commune H4-8]
MSSTDFIAPRGLSHSDGNYAAQDQVIDDLLRYIEIVQSLPETIAEYQERFGFSLLIVSELDQVLEGLFEAYTRVKGDSCECRDAVYPGILQAAVLISDYARTAPDTTRGIFELVRDLDNTTDEAMAQLLIEQIDDSISEQIEEITVLGAGSNGCSDSLHKLERRMKESQQLVKQRSDDLHEVIATLVEIIEDGEKQLKALPEMVAQTTAPYEQDQLAADAAPSYSLLDFSRASIMSAITSVRGAAAAKTADLADDVWAIVTNDGGGWDPILAELAAMDADLKATLNLVNTATDDVEQIIGGWTAISSDLDNLRDMFKNDIKSADQYTAGLIEKNIISDLKHLADEVAEYEGAAHARPRRPSADLDR